MKWSKFAKVNKYLPDIKFHNWKDIYFGDLETVTEKTKYYQDHNATRPHFGYLLNAETKKGFLFRDFKELFRTFERDLKKRNLIIYFHNLYFDGMFLLDFLAKNKKYQIVNKINFKAKTNQVSIFRKDNKLYRIKVYYAPHKNIIEFRCSYQLLNMSIASLGQIIGIPKLETDYDVEFQDDINKYPPEFIAYCKQDVRILCKGFKQFYYLFLKEFNTDMIEAFTSSQMAYNSLMQHILSLHNWNQDTEDAFNSMNEFIKLDSNTWELGHNFYYGGFTQFLNLPEGSHKVICKKGIKIDINSSYPYAMTMPLPYGRMYNLKDEQPTPNEEHIKFYEIKINYAKSKYPNINVMRNWNHAGMIEYETSEEFFSSDHPDEYVSDLYNVKAYYMEHELALMEQFYYMKFEIINTYWFKAKRYAKEWINKLYEIKSNPNTPKPLKQLSKLLMNSSYGKFGQHPLNTEYYICKDEQEFKELKGEDITDDNGISWHYYEPFSNDLPGYFVLKRRQIDHHPTKLLRHIWVAATITSYARINLLWTLLKVGVENFVYCDTDSLILANYDHRLTRFLDASKLGRWKDESKEHGGIKEVQIIGKKWYRCIYNDNTEDYKTSGVSDSVSEQFSKNELDDIFSNKKTMLENAVYKMTRVEGGLTMQVSNYMMKPRRH